MSSIPRIARRAFSTTAPTASKIGSAPITLPPGVSLTENILAATGGRALKPVVAGESTGAARELSITGPLGAMSLTLPPYANLTQDTATSKALLTVADPKIRKQREMWGTLRAQLANHVTGVSEGHICILRLVGVGYRASVEERPAPPGYADLPNAANKSQRKANRPLPPFGSPKQDTGRVRAKIDEKGNIKVVNLKVQYAHPVELPVPEGVEASCPVPTRILLQGRNKQLVKQFAAEIREWRKPEPYKGKGIFVDDETIKLKNRKIK